MFFLKLIIPKNLYIIDFMNKILILFVTISFFYSSFLFSDSYRTQNQSENLNGTAISVFGSALDFAKGFLPFFDSEEELIAKAEQLCEVKKRLVSIRQVVYQSVKAPQIERLDEEGMSPFDDYDLIRGKPAGAIVRIRKSYRVREEGLEDADLDFEPEKLMENFDFVLSLKINDELYNETLCSKKLEEGVVNYKVDLSSKKKPEEETFTAEPANCAFNWEDLENGPIYKFVSLPMKLGEPLGENLGPAEVKILSQLKPKSSGNDKFIKVCESSEEFRVNRLDSKSFKVLFTGIEGPYCKDENDQLEEAYPTTDYSDIMDYLNSKEVRKGFYDMFPVSNRRPYKPEMSLLQENNQLLFPIGNCEKGKGYIADAATLSKARFAHGGDIIFYVVKEGYADYHELGDIMGKAFSTLPTRYISTPFGDIFFSYKRREGVGLVLAGDEETGTFLHELGHILGQKKEHYEELDPYYCAQFTRRGRLPGKSAEDDLTGSSCYTYRVTGGLVMESDVRPRLSDKPRRQVWKLLNNQKSVMHTDYSMRVNDIYWQWIDRETYQKALRTLDNELIVPEGFIKRIKKDHQLYEQPHIIKIKQKLDSLANCDLERRPVVIFSGVYDKKEQNKTLRLTDVSVRAYAVEGTGNPFSSAELSIGPKKEETDHIRIQLKRKGELEEELVFPRKFYIETFYKDRHAEREEADSFPLFADFFPACDSSFDEDDYTLSVKEIYNESGVQKENILIDSLPVQWGREL